MTVSATQAANVALAEMKQHAQEMATRLDVPAEVARRTAEVYRQAADAFRALPCMTPPAIDGRVVA